MFKFIKDKYTIEDAIQDRKNKTYMKKANAIVDDFKLWFENEVKWKLRNSNMPTIACFGISSVRDRLEYSNKYIYTGTMTYEIYKLIKHYVQEMCDKYNWELIEKGQLNFAGGGRNGVDFWVNTKELEEENVSI